MVSSKFWATLAYFKVVSDAQLPESRVQWVTAGSALFIVIMGFHDLAELWRYGRRPAVEDEDEGEPALGLSIGGNGPAAGGSAP